MGEKTREVEKIVLGNEYTDTITGFAGKATAYCAYLSGSDRVELSKVVNGSLEQNWANAEDIQD